MKLLDRDTERPNLRIVAVDDNALAFRGVLRDADVHVWLSALVDEIHERAVGRKLAEVIVDLRELEYANAAAWRCFIYWLRKLDAESRQKYKLRIRGNPAQSWQSLGIRALVPFSRERLVIEL
jgi:hypothetical protein